MQKWIVTASIALFIMACTDLSTDSNQQGSLAFYTVQDAAMTAYEAKQTMQSVVLSATPLFTVKDITVYHWSTHTFSGTAALDSTIHSFSAIPGKSYGLPFIVTIGSERIYVGAFWYPYSSLRPPVPSINPTLGAPYQISKSPVDSLDVRNDDRIHQALVTAGVIAP